MRKAAAVALTLLFHISPTNVAAQASLPCRPTVTGRVDVVPSESRVFHNQRYLRVWVPPGYSEPANAEKRYPALYMMDGQMLFGDCMVGAPDTEWGFDETLSRLIANGAIPPMIVVGIDSMFREYELIPYRDPFFLPDSPEPIGRQFPDFLARDIVPLITKRYRVTSGPQAIGGWSYGAVAALWAMIARPDLFILACSRVPLSESAMDNCFAIPRNYSRARRKSFWVLVTASSTPTRAMSVTRKH